MLPPIPAINIALPNGGRGGPFLTEGGAGPPNGGKYVPSNVLQYAPSKKGGRVC